LNASGPREAACGGEQSGVRSGHLRLLSPPSDALESGSVRSGCSTVASAPVDDVEAALRLALESWTASGDRSALRRQLLTLLMLLETKG
jgi:hypothetical protein